MTVSHLLSLIPRDLIEFLEAETQVNHQVKKLNASIVFKLILFSMIENNKVSLRVMEAYAGSAKFRKFADVKDLNTRYNSICDRIHGMNSDFFQGIFHGIFDIYNELLGEQNSLIKVDSTMVGISSKLVDWSLKGGGSRDGSRKHVKISLSLKGSLPCSVSIYTTAEMASEDKALRDHMEKASFYCDEVVVFDRGVQARKTFDELTNKDQVFVGRLKKEATRSIQQKNLPIPLKPSDSTVTITKDVECRLLQKNNKVSEHRYRLVTGIIDSSSEEIVFVTNSESLNAYEVAALYKQRWDIEVFFKFLKQHLNLGHISSRKENGMTVIIYMTMILSILLTVYKKLNKISSNKIAKLKFSLELDNIMTREIVILCGGDPSKAPHLFRDS